MFSHFKKLFSTSSVSLAVKEQLKKRPVRSILRQGDNTQPTQSMAIAVCTADSYDLSSFSKRISEYSQLQNRDVLHFKHQPKASEADLDVFFFRHGSFVVWNSIPNLCSSKLLQEIRDVVRPYEKTPIPFQETEEIPFM
jgi:uncharacterized Rmd1/YagE family protein